MRWNERAGRRMRPRDLHIFMAVAEHGTMAKAAEALAVSRPVVSKSIAELERILGVPLFDRNAMGIELTRFGQALLRRSAAIFDEIRLGMQDIASLADPGAGEVRVGCNAVMAAGLLPAAIIRLSRRFPRVAFHLEQATVPTVPIHFLRERRCEVVVARLLESSLPADMAVERLFDDPLRVVVGPTSPWARRRAIALADLAGEPWILAPAETLPGAPIHEGFKGAGMELPRARVLSTSVSFRHSLLATGRFITGAPASLLRYGADREAFVPLPIHLPTGQRSIAAIVTLKGRTLSPVVQRFIDGVREVARPMATARSA